MCINFFDESCQSKTSHVEFGLCDDTSSSNNHSPAYIETDTNKSEKWIATVKNDQEIEITFTAIDHCISIFRSEENKDNSCDGMLTYDKCIIFVELKLSNPQKDKWDKKWIEKGITQLKKTIKAFEDNYGLTIYTSYTSKKAYIANPKKPNIESKQTDKLKKFYNETGFTLRIQPTIKI